MLRILGKVFPVDVAGISNGHLLHNLACCSIQFVEFGAIPAIVMGPEVTVVIKQPAGLLNGSGKGCPHYWADCRVGIGTATIVGSGVWAIVRGSAIRTTWLALAQEGDEQYQKQKKCVSHS